MFVEISGRDAEWIIPATSKTAVGVAEGLSFRGRGRRRRRECVRGRRLGFRDGGQEANGAADVVDGDEEQASYVRA